MLKKLNLGGNPIDILPDCVRSLTRLDELVLNNCQRLKTFLFVPKSIKCLATYDCFSLEEITFHQEKPTPTEVDYFDAIPLTGTQEKLKLQVLA
jgi:hypothetical protein